MVKERFARQLWISFGIVLGSIAIAGGLLFFLFGKMSDQADAIVNDRAMVQGKTDAVATLAQLEGAAAQATQYQAAIGQLLPDQYGVVTFPQWLAGLGTKYNVVASAAFQGSIAPSAGTTPGTASFTFTATGTSANLAEFLSDMVTQSSGFLVSLASFSVTGDGSNESMTGQGTLFFR